MRRDWNIIRDLMLDLTEEVRDWRHCLAARWSADAVWEHALILQEGGFVVGVPDGAPPTGTDHSSLVDVRATWSGHEMADPMRNGKFWAMLHFKAGAAGTSESLTYAAIQAYLEDYVRDAMLT